jgi:3-oxoacyl-[acyl-carrier protein] reductase
VTGGSRGIGGEVVELFARYGAEVAFCHFGDAANAEALAGRLTAAGHKVYGTECDVSDEAAVGAMATWAKDKLGQVDILVNMAGIGGDKAFVDLTIADWDRMLGVHLRGHFLVTGQFFGDMVARGYGRVVNCASQLAYRGAPGLAHYCAAKAGIVGFTRALAHDLGPDGITVNCVVPGFIGTPRPKDAPQPAHHLTHSTISGARGKPEDVAAMVRFLCGPAARYITGQAIHANGGAYFGA